VTLQILGICSALAVTSALLPSLLMTAAVISVLAFSSTTISLVRNLVPTNTRLIVQMTIIASAVIVVDQLLEAYAFETSSLLDGSGNGLGYGLVLIGVATLRELFGAGTLLGYPVLPSTADGGWYEPNGMMLLPPSAFFIIGLMIWGVRSWKTAQVERPDYQIHEVHRLEVK